MTTYHVQIKIDGDDRASPALRRVSAEVERLQAKLERAQRGGVFGAPFLDQVKAIRLVREELQLIRAPITAAGNALETLTSRSWKLVFAFAAISAAAPGVLTFLGKLAGASGLAAAGLGGLIAGGITEDQTAQLAAALGSAQKAAEQMRAIQEVARRTRISQSAFAQGATSAAQFGVGFDAAALQGVADIAAGTGVGEQGVPKIMEALAKFQRELDPKALKVLEGFEFDKKNKTLTYFDKVSGKMKTIQADVKNLADARRVIEQIFAAQAGAAATVNNTLFGQFEIFFQKIKQTFSKLGTDNGLVAGLRDQLASINRVFEAAFKSGQIDRILKNVASAITALFGIDGDAGQAFQGLLDWLESQDWTAWARETRQYFIQLYYDALNLVDKISNFLAKAGEIGAKIWQGVEALAAFVGGWENLLIIVGLAMTGLLGPIVTLFKSFIVIAHRAISYVAGLLLQGVGAAITAIAGGGFLGKLGTAFMWLGGILKKVFWPLTIIMAVIDAAIALFGALERGDSIGSALAQAVGAAVDSATFGLLGLEDAAREATGGAPKPSESAAPMPAALTTASQDANRLPLPPDLASDLPALGDARAQLDAARQSAGLTPLAPGQSAIGSSLQSLTGAAGQAGEQQLSAAARLEQAAAKIDAASQRERLVVLRLEGPAAGSATVVSGDGGIDIRYNGSGAYAGL